MAKRVIALVAVVVMVVVVATYAYSHYRQRRSEAGEVLDESGTAVGSGSSGSGRTAARQDTAEDGNGDGAAAPKRTVYPPAAPPKGTPVQNAIPAAPATDTIAANPPNGMVFAGTGKFQVYRQGDLTWRVNTASGQTCILFATEEQWRKPVVYRNGCGRG